jgi:hypothetical protein
VPDQALDGWWAQPLLSDVLLIGSRDEERGGVLKHEFEFHNDALTKIVDLTAMPQILAGQAGLRNAGGVDK